MSQYTTNTSDKKKVKALRWWLIGCIGLLGLENFYVGKVKNGIVRLILGLCVLSAIAQIFFTPEVIAGILLWAIIAFPNFIRIKMGVFKDNVGDPLRE